MGGGEIMTPDVNQWLSDHAPFYSILPTDEVETLKNFSVLWSYTEALCFKGRANKGEIANFARREKNGVANIQRIRTAYAYYSDRYFLEQDAARRLSQLCPQPEGRKIEERLIEIRQISKPANSDMIEFALLVVYRLRNNFFHGAKANYGYVGQKLNFEHAVAVLMETCELP